MTSIYRTSEGETVIHALYDHQLDRLGSHFESHMVDTRFGATHVLALGPEDAAQYQAGGTGRF